MTQAPFARVRSYPLPRPPLRVLALGDVHHPEFAEPLASLRSESLLSIATPSELNAGHRFDLIVVCQSRPGSFDRKQVEGLAVRHPLAGRLVLLGSWCEGETRTGRPLADFRRLFWYQFALWWRLTRAAWQRGEPTDWQQAPGDATAMTWPEQPAGLIAISSASYSFAETLIDTCRQLGHAACWCPRGAPWPVTSPPTAGIWVGEMFEASEEPHLKAFRQWLPPFIPLLALFDFPRSDRVNRAQELGATSVLGKPWRIDQLAAALAP